ncbi:Tetraacyldisaccharide 4'-kinase [Thioalkalivibrio nitratireducens DSM 14787]|uniref:Tetraacyldisaccharide 4'-kinase n=2 Tax=Thioalkalivibrio nitratireducens TaxID=186931 RepID=L0DU58_THIND|nr:tetraacyldisaccharide 4'-kinase [Thioalkalivibrio nitratireducens]AGA32530.1 Tetraacyldisaccharide 4'-kinase [Thioalkalivibrio nitratireducens DSM 14787]
MVEQWLWRQWSHRGPFAAAMFPLSLLYAGLAGWRRSRLEDTQRHVVLPLKAVIVVGNLTVGGSGKTPMTAWLAQSLKRAGYWPGIVSRGYGRRNAHASLPVHPGADPSAVGDEPILLARRTGVPVWVDRDRVRAARALAAQGVDVVISDDGLQHHRLPRDISILMLDGKRRLGNGLCLPAGPLREPGSAVACADFVVVTGGSPQGGEYAMRLETPGTVSSVGRHGVQRPQREFAGRPAHAVAGIADPERFFTALEAAGVDVIRHPFPDHHRFHARDIDFDDQHPVLMTEKDAVKCREFADERHWYWPVSARPDPAFEPALLRRLESMIRLKYLG